MRCDLSRLLSRKITKRVHSSKPASLNHPIHENVLFTNLLRSARCVFNLFVLEHDDSIYSLVHLCVYALHIAGQCDSTRSRSHCQSSDPPCSVSTRGQGFSVRLNRFTPFLSCFGGIYSSFVRFLLSLKVFGNLGKQSCLFLDLEKKTKTKNNNTETRVALYVFKINLFFTGCHSQGFV